MGKGVVEATDEGSQDTLSPCLCWERQTRGHKTPCHRVCAGSDRRGVTRHPVTVSVLGATDEGSQDTLSPCLCWERQTRGHKTPCHRVCAGSDSGTCASARSEKMHHAGLSHRSQHHSVTSHHNKTGPPSHYTNLGASIEHQQYIKEQITKHKKAQNQSTRELIRARKPSHQHNNKDPSRLW